MKAGSILLRVLLAVIIAVLAAAASWVLETSYAVSNAPVLVLGGAALAAFITMVFAVFSLTQKMSGGGDKSRALATTPQPLVIQKPVYSTVSLDQFGSGYFSHFMIFNSGDGPAIELACAVSRDKKTPLMADRTTFLRSGEEKRVIFNLTGLEKGQYYFTTNYLRISPASNVGSYARTCLPFEVNRSGQNILVKTGEITFEFNLQPADRIVAPPEKEPAV